MYVMKELTHEPRLPDNKPEKGHKQGALRRG